MTKLAYLKFLQFVIEHAHPYSPRHGWQEVIGFIFGRFNDSPDEPEVFITDVLPMDSGSSVYVKIGDYTPIYPVLMEKLEQDEFIVGWIHSHPGLSIFLSGTDLNTQRIYQKIDPKSIAIVVDHTKINTSFPGLKAFRVDNGSYSPISISIEGVLDFNAVYQQIIRSIPSPIQPSPFSAANIVELDQIRLELNGPTTWNDLDKPFHITLSYESNQEGYIQLEYIPKIQGATLMPMQRSMNRHSIYESGILAIFNVKLKSNSDFVRFNLDHLIIINKEGTKMKISQLDFIVNNSLS